MAREAWQPRSAQELHAQQRDASQAFDAFCASREATENALTGSRNQLVESRIRLAAIKKAQEALVARAAQQVQQSNAILEASAPVRVVVAYRKAWAGQKVSEALISKGAHVLALLDDGAELVGTAIAEQPDLIITEGLLPTVTGIDAVSQILEFSPRAFVAVQVETTDQAPVFLEAGARAVFSRLIPPPAVADRVWEALRGLEEPFAVL